jgi:hypothetical protein
LPPGSGDTLCRVTSQDPLGAVPRQEARSRLWGRLKAWNERRWQRWEARHVLRYATGKVVVLNASVSKTLAFWERENERKWGQ